LKKRNHNSPPANAGVEQRALEKAAALLVRAIAAQLKQYPAPPAPAPERCGDARNRKAIERVIPPTSAPAAREEAVRIAARLYTLGGVCSDLALPLKISASWLPLAEVGAFSDRV